MLAGAISGAVWRGEMGCVLVDVYGETLYGLEDINICKNLSHFCATTPLAAPASTSLSSIVQKFQFFKSLDTAGVSRSLLSYLATYFVISSFQIFLLSLL